MRNELEHLAGMEQYLLGQHPDPAAFARNLQTDPTLRADVQLLRELLQAIEAQGLKTEIARARSTRTLLRALRYLGAALLLSAALLAAVLVYNGGIRHGEKGPQIRTELPAENEIGDTGNWVQADSVLPALVYTLSATRDEVVETPEGIIVSMPQGSFLHKNGEPVTGGIELEIKEAMDPATIMKAGLSTWSDGRLLETGGMFYINARQNGENLQIAKNANITASIPKLENRSDMMLFDGVRVGGNLKSGEDEEADNGPEIGYQRGEINWVNPRKPITELVSVPMDLLNFYPPGFEAKLAESGYPDKEKAFRDSVYLSFKTDGETSTYKENILLDSLDAGMSDYSPNGILNISHTRGETLFRLNCTRCHSIGNNKIVGPGLRNVRSRWPSDADLVSWIQHSSEYLKTGDRYTNDLYEKYNKSAMPHFSSMSKEEIISILDYIDGEYTQMTGINPVSVLAFWNKGFDRTILATKEFETRMQYIHGTCDERLLECYTKHMDQPLYYCDSLAMMRSYGEQQDRFLDFYARKHGKPADGKKFTSALLSLFAQKQRELDAAYNRTTGAWLRQQALADQKAAENGVKQWERNTLRETSNFTKEMEKNLCEAKTQLGKSCADKPIFSRNIRDNYNTYPIQTTGWKNVDAYVAEATLNRTSMDYVDPYTGQKAKLTYTPITVTVKSTVPFQITEVYLIPSGKLSFMRMKNSNGTYTESLNALYRYHLVAVGYRGNEIFVYTQENILPGTITVEPKSSTAGVLNQFVSRNGSQRAMDDMHYELQNLQFQSAEIQRNAQRLVREKLREALLPVVFPCGERALLASSDSLEIIEAIQLPATK